MIIGTLHGNIEKDEYFSPTSCNLMQYGGSAQKVLNKPLAFGFYSMKEEIRLSFKGLFSGRALACDSTQTLLSFSISTKGAKFLPLGSWSSEEIVPLRSLLV